MKSPADFRDQLKIDKSAMDNELVKQPQLVYEVGRSYALAVSKRDSAKNDLKRTSVRVADEIKDDEKVSATEAAKRIVLKAEYMKGEAGLRILDRRVHEWDALRSAVNAKGFALRELADLLTRDMMETGAAKTTAQRARRRSV